MKNQNSFVSTGGLILGSGKGGLSGNAGDFLKTSGGSMMGPIAYFPSVKTIASDRLDISSETGAYSSYVIVTGEGATHDDLIAIDGGAFGGQFILLQGVIGINLTIKNQDASGNIRTPDGNDFVLEGNQIVQLYLDIVSATPEWVLVAGSGSGGLTEPVQYSVKDHGDVGSSTESITADTHNVFRLRLTGDIGISISSTLASSKFEMLHLHIIQDGTGGHEVTSWDSAINGTPTIDTTAGSVTTVSLFSLDQGTTWFFVSSKGGILGSTAYATTALDNLISPVLNTSIDFDSHAPTNFIGFTTPLAGQALVADGNGFTFDTPAADEYLLRIGGTTEFKVTNALVDVVSKGISNFIGFTTPTAGQTLSYDATGATFTLPSSDQYDFKVNGVSVAVFTGAGHALAGGSLNMNSQKIVNVTDPASAQDAATKNYVDSIGTSFSDDVFEIYDNTTPTKILQFSLASMVAGTSLLGTNTLTAARTWTLPDISSTIAVLGGTQTFSGEKTFGSGNLKLRNPADTFSYTITPAAIVADRTLNMPLITGTDTLAALAMTQTFSGANTFSGTVDFTGASVSINTSSLFAINCPSISFGDATSDLIQFIGRIKQNTDIIPESSTSVDLGSSSILMDNIYTDDLFVATRIKSNSATEIGIQVTNTSYTIGSVGSIILPISSTVTTSKTTLDGLYGNLAGAAGILDSGSGNLTLWVRQSDGNWAAVNLARDQGT